MTESRGEERDQHFQTDHLTPLKFKRRMCHFFFFVMYSCWDVLQAQKSFLPGRTAPGLLGVSGGPDRSPGPAALGAAGTMSPKGWFGDADSD